MKLTPLDPWISKKISSNQSQLTRQEIEVWQLLKLNETLALARSNSAYYRNHFTNCPNTISSLDELRQFPFTTPDDIRPNPLQFVCVSQDEIQRVVTLQSSGTTGEPKRVYFTADDQELTIDFFGVGMSTLVEPGERVLILLPGETPGSVGDLLRIGLHRLGMIPIPYGPVRDPLLALETIQRERADCLVGSPTQVLGLSRFWQPGMHKPRSVLLSTDYVPQAIVRVLEKVWRCKVYNHYGMTEMGLGGGVECQARSGYHVREADLYFEIVHPQTGKSLPDGETGEVVFTTLTRKGMPLIRYRTGDLSRFLPNACPCGTILKSLEKIMLRICGSVSIYDRKFRHSAQLSMADLDEALFPINGLVNFSTEIRQSGKIIELHITAMTLPAAKPGMAARVSAALQSVPAVASARKANELQVFTTVEDFNPERMGSLAKRAIIDRRGV